MSIEVIYPKNEEEWLGLRTHDVTSTDVAALFGISPYITIFELWHRKRSGSIVKIADNYRMKWGRRLQNSIAYGIAQDQGWDVREMKEYIRDSALRIGSSFDFSIDTLNAPGNEKKVMTPQDRHGVLEIKNVDALAFREGWIVDGENVEAPPHIELQVQHQMLVSGRRIAYIGALVGGNTVQLIRREYDLEVGQAIMERVAEFWKSIEGGTAPAPNFAQDAAFIAKLYGYAEPGKMFDARGNEHVESLMGRYKEALDLEKSAKSEKDSVKAEMLMIIGDAEKVVGDFGSISAGMIGPTRIEAYDRAGYRNFKPYIKKPKGA